MPFDGSTADDCVHCGSAQTREVVNEHDDHVEVLRYCNMCRRDEVIWRGTRPEYLRMRAVQRGIARRIAHASRRRGSYPS